MKEKKKQQDSAFIQTCKRCVVHVKKHMKICIGTGLGMIMIAIIGMILMPIGNSGKVSEVEALSIFYQIEKVAEEKDIILHKIGKERFAIWEANFHKVKEEFYKRNDLTERFKIAQKLDSLIHRQDGFTELKGYVTQSEADEFKKLEEKFDSLYNIAQKVSRSEKSDTYKQEADKIFNGLFDIAKQREEILYSIGIDNFRAWEVSYHDNVSRFSKADTINERYDPSKDISNLLYRQDEYFRQQGYIGTGKYITDTEEKIYQDTQDAFNQIK